MIFINTSKIMSGNDIIKSESTKIDGNKSALTPGAFNSSASGALTSAISAVAASYATISNILNDLHTFLNNYSSDAEGGEYSLSDSGGEIIDDAVYAAIKNCEDLLDDISMGSKLFTSLAISETGTDDSNSTSQFNNVLWGLLCNGKSEVPLPYGNLWLEYIKDLVDAAIEDDNKSWINLYDNLNLIFGVMDSSGKTYTSPDSKPPQHSYTTTINGKPQEIEYRYLISDNFDPSKTHSVAVIFDGGTKITDNYVRSFDSAFNYKYQYDAYMSAYEEGKISDDLIIINVNLKLYQDFEGDNYGGLICLGEDISTKLMDSVAEQISGEMLERGIDVSSDDIIDSLSTDRKDWYLSGHSLGGKTLAQIASQDIVIEKFGNFYLSSPALYLNTQTDRDNTYRIFDAMSDAIKEHPDTSVTFSTGANEYTTDKGKHTLDDAIYFYKKCNEDNNNTLIIGDNFNVVFRASLIKNSKGEDSLNIGHNNNDVYGNIDFLSSSLY